MNRFTRMSPEGLLVWSFLAAVILGAVLLALPWCHGGGVSVLDALFTATSAVCVTGLAVVDTGGDFTLWGQLVILLLIQVGGLGIMMFAAMAYELLGRRLHLRAQAALTQSVLQREAADEFRFLFRRILLFVLGAEAVGAVVLFLGLWPRVDAAHAAYSAVFHAVSAFCNAGFSLYTDSLTAFGSNPLVMLAVMVLITLGGIGHPVALDVWRRLRNWRPRTTEPARRRLTLHARVALLASAILTVGGGVLFAALGVSAPGTSWPQRLLDALFQSVTARTAGFNTVPMGELALAPMVLMIILMFVGGSPGSCAGGVKTTTVAVWLGKMMAGLRGREAPRLFARDIPGEVAQRVSTIISLAFLWNLMGILLLSLTEGGTPGVGLRQVMFEQISAFGTVGLSTGLTPDLSLVGKLWIMLTMFIGRLGPLTLAVFMFRRKQLNVRYPEGRIMIG